MDVFGWKESVQNLKKASNGVFFFFSSILCECGLFLGLLSHLEPLLTFHGGLGMVVGVYGGVEAQKSLMEVMNLHGFFIFFFFLLLSSSSLYKPLSLSL